MEETNGGTKYSEGSHIINSFITYIFSDINYIFIYYECRLYLQINSCNKSL